MSETCDATDCSNEAVKQIKADDPAAFEPRWDAVCEEHYEEAKDRGAVIETEDL